jgi:hypothetical protein
MSIGYKIDSYIYSEPFILFKSIKKNEKNYEDFTEEEKDEFYKWCYFKFLDEEYENNDEITTELQDDIIYDDNAFYDSSNRIILFNGLKDGIITLVKVEEKEAVINEDDLIFLMKFVNKLVEQNRISYKTKLKINIPFY